MPMTLEQALALPQASYVTCKQAGIRIGDVVSAETDGLVITNPTSRFTIPHTAELATCLCIAIENVRTGMVAVAHLTIDYQPEALRQMIQLARRSPKDALHIHMIGGCYDNADSDDPASDYSRWQTRMQRLLDVINTTPNTTLLTFDVGHKPHPIDVAFAKDVTGKTCLVRGSLDFTSCAEIDDPKPRQAVVHRTDFLNVERRFTPDEFRPSAEHPFCLTWDGRLPENQQRGMKPRFSEKPLGRL